MKRNFLSLLMFVTVSLLSCKDDDKKDPVYSFKDQEAQGKTANESWTYKDGIVNVDGEMLWITLTLEQAEKACDIGDIGKLEGYYIAFGVDKEVKLNLLNTEANVIAVTFSKAGGVDQQFSTTGAIEITSITDTTISGKIDARIDAENFVNGNFTVPVCPQ